MRLYRALLHLYPRSFRLEYQRELIGLFEARRRQTRGALGRLGLYVSALVEVSANAAAGHLDLLRQDLRHIVRSFGRAPGFVMTAVLVIGLGVGASAAAFSVTEFVLFRPLPFPEPDRLVRLWETRPGYGQMELTPPNARDWRMRQTSLDSLGLFNVTAANLTGAGDPVRLSGAAVEGAWFDVLDVPAHIGRTLTADDERPNAPLALVISHSLWRDRFGGSPDAIGRAVRLDGDHYTIVGVMPPAFAAPSRQAQFWSPIRIDADDYLDRTNNYLHAIGRLARGHDLESARRDFQRIAAQLEQEHPATNQQAGANLYPLREGYSRATRTLVLALAGAAGCLLLITLVNLLNLLLARLLSRRREMAVRTAMGAGRERLVRQLMTEMVVLAGVGGLLGVAVASAAVPLFTRLTPTNLPVAGLPSVDWRVWTFAAALTAGIAVVTGLMPAFTGRGLSALREGERAGGGARERVRGALVVVSVVASVVLLAGAGLLLRAMWQLQSVDPGFRAEGVLTVRTPLPMPQYAGADVRSRWYRQVVEDVRALPGVRNAAYISFLPMQMGGGIWPVVMQGDEVRRERGNVASLRYVTPGFFDTMGVPIHAGRDVRDSDTADAPWVAVVSESFVERYFPEGGAIGRRFGFALGEREIVGVAGNVRNRGLEEDSEPQVYVPAGQVEDASLTFYVPKELVIAVSGERPAVAGAVRDVIRRADPDLPIANVQWLPDVVAGETASRGVQLRVLLGFAAMALLLAGVGLHGLLGFVVSERRREIGVRVALGAQRSGIVRMVLGRAALIAGVGLAAGLALALMAGRMMTTILAGVPPADPLTAVSVAALVGFVALSGSLAPAWRAARVDPVRALRAD